MTSLVGRAGELSQLEAALSRAAAGRGCLALLAGEPGIGKTRLADELANIAADQGTRAIWGRCWESGGAPAFWPWTQVLDGLRRHAVLSDDDMRRLSNHLEGVAGSSDPERDRFALYQTVLELLRVAAARAPLLIILDDVHAADLSSLHLLSFVARGMRDVGVLVLCTFRDAEARMDAQTSEVLSRVVREGVLISLGRIEQDDVLALLRERGIRESEALAHQVFERTEGNPLFTRELIELLATKRGAGELPIPLSVRETIRQRVAPCSATLRELLAAAAVVGKEHDARLVSRMLRKDFGDVVSCLDEALERGLLVARGDGQYAFSHVMIRDVLYADAPAATRMALHEAAAAALDASRHTERSHHLLLAGPTAYERAVHAAVAAARDAASIHAHDDAVALLQRTREVVEGPGASPLVCEVLLALGTTYWRAGHHASAKQVSLEAADLARALGDPERLARAALAYGGEFEPGRTDPTLIALLREARQGLPAEHTALHARLLARLAAGLQPAPDPHEPVAMALEAIALARQGNDPGVLLDVLYAAIAALVEYTRPDTMLPLCDELRVLCAEAGDHPKLLRALVISIFIYLEANRRGQALALVEEYRALAGKLALPPHRWPIKLIDACIAAIDGRIADAERLAHEGEETARAAGIAVELRVAAHLFALHYTYDCSRLEEAVVRVGQTFMQMPGGKFYVDYLQAFLAHRRGDEARAQALLEAADPALIEREPGTIEVLAEVCVHARSALPWVERCYLQLLRNRDWFFSWGSFAFMITSPVERVLGLLAQGLGRQRDAEAHFLRAIEMCELMHHQPMHAHVRYDLARFYSMQGDPLRAAPLAEEALERATALGMTGLAGRARELLATLKDEPLPETARSALAELAAGIAHEINTPLSAIQSNIDVAGRALSIIKDAAADPELAAVIGKNRKLARAFDALAALQQVTPEAAARIQRVVLDLSAYAQLDRAAFAPVDVNDSLDGVLRLLGHRTAAVDIRRQYGELPRVPCHPQRLNDALMAVCATVLDRFDNGGTLTLSTRASARAVILTLASTARPFSEEERVRLFEPALGRHGGQVGMRLELAIAKRTFEEHGGSLVVEERDGGLRFRLRLPLEAKTETHSETNTVSDSDAKAAPAPSPEPARIAMERRGEMWLLRHRDGEPLVLKDSRGLRILARLIAAPEQEIHVLDLTEGGPGEVIDTGDAGEVLDPTARQAYRERARALQQELAEAEAHHDLGRAEKLQQELDFLTAELSRAMGIGGRERRSGRAAERARVAVQRALKAALKKIAAHDAEVGAYLDYSVRTGAFCCFHPRGRVLG